VGPCIHENTLVDLLRFSLLPPTPFFPFLRMLPRFAPNLRYCFSGELRFSLIFSKIPLSSRRFSLLMLPRLSFPRTRLHSPPSQEPFLFVSFSPQGRLSTLILRLQACVFFFLVSPFRPIFRVSFPGVRITSVFYVFTPSPEGPLPDPPLPLFFSYAWPPPTFVSLRLQSFLCPFTTFFFCPDMPSLHSLFFTISRGAKKIFPLLEISFPNWGLFVPPRPFPLGSFSRCRARSPLGSEHLPFSKLALFFLFE